MNKPTKSERVSFRCTKKEKEKLESRSEKLGMSLTDYAAKMLFSDVNDCTIINSIWKRIASYGKSVS